MQTPRRYRRITLLCATALAAAVWTSLALPAGAVGPAGRARAPERACTLPPGLTEISGMAMSTKHPGVFYAVNDSGNTNQVFAVDCSGTAGQLKATYTLTGAANTDWEALAVGPDQAGNSRIIVGDIGDNFGSRSQITVHAFPEPEQLADTSVTATAANLAYSDGRHDAESLLAHPTTGQLYVASKLNGTAGTLYQAPLPPPTDQTGTLTPVRPAPVWATDGAYSPSGGSYVLRSGGPFGPNTGYVYDSAGTALAEVPLPAQPQGETVTYADCTTLLAASENDTQVWRVPLPPEATPGCSS